MAIYYNLLNLPQLINVNGKGTVAYLYDAQGAKLKKTVSEPSVPMTTTDYIGGMVYSNNVLQFISHEEGRIRYKPGVQGMADTYVYDYFLKDHLGNVRMVLTDERETNA